MSLWEKWEREKLRKQGFEVEEPKTVEIHKTTFRPDLRKQILVILLILFACFSFIAFFTVTEVFSGGKKWSETFFAQLLVERNKQRESMSTKP